MKTPLVLLPLLAMLSAGAMASFGQQAVSDEARRHFDRGMAAVETAKSPDDFAPAINEFQQALQLAPNWATAYYNLGMVQEKAGKYADAIRNLGFYIQLSPDAADIGSVKSLMNRLQYKKEMEEGLSKVYDMLVMNTTIARWVQIGKTGDDAPDWELEHNDDFRQPEKRNAGLFIKKNGTLYKTNYGVEPSQSYIFPDFGLNLPAVTVHDKSFEYRYPIYMVWIMGYPEDLHGTPLYNTKHGGEMVIKAEIISVNPAKIKKTQAVKWPDGHLTQTEFIYELR